MNKSNLILVHFDRQMTESEFFDAMSEVYDRNGTVIALCLGIRSTAMKERLSMLSMNSLMFFAPTYGNQ